MPQTTFRATCPQHETHDAELVVEYRLPDPINPADWSDTDLALACTDQCAADLRASLLLLGAHPAGLDTRPATPEDIAEITGMEVAA